MHPGRALSNAFSAATLLFLVGCPWWSPPDTTSEAGMVGVVTGSDGAPVVELLVETVESTVRTDDEGRFGLYYKPPDTHVYFTYEDAWYRRVFREQDRGKTVEIALPKTRSLDVACGGFDCALRLHWDLGPGMSARRTGRCKAGETLALPGSPMGTPTVSCRTKVTEPELPLSLQIDGDRLELLPPPRNIRVEVMSDEEPDSCQVYVQGRQLSEKEGGYIGITAGEAGVQVVCDGRAALPVSIGADANAVEVPWTAEGPVLRPPPGMELDRLRLSMEGGWVLEHRAQPSGGFALPPLPPGSYTIQLYSNEASPLPTTLPEDLEVGVVKGQLLPTGQYAAALRLERDLGDGVLEAMLIRD